MNRIILQNSIIFLPNMALQSCQDFQGQRLDIFTIKASFLK